jgi:signal peptidase II
MNKKVRIAAFLLFLVDLVSKIIILKTNIKMPYEIIPNFFYIHRVYNTGAAFSFLAGTGANIAFMVLGIVALIYIDRRLISEVRMFIGDIGVSLLYAGVLGNVFDRFLYGKVVDFISLRFGSYSFPIFNFADVFICIGVILVLIDYYGGKRWK